MKKISLDSATAAALDLPEPPRPLPIRAQQTIHMQVREARFGPLMKPLFRDLLAHSSSTLALLGGVSGYWRRVHGTR